VVIDYAASDPVIDRSPAAAKTARLTIVIETVTPGEYEHRGHSDHDPGDTIAALVSQCEPELIEILLVVNGPVDGLTERFADRPNIRILPVDIDTYYGMKNAGGRVADTEYVAFTDSDCLPGPLWIKTIIEELDKGADVVCGRSRYQGPGLWAWTLTFFDLGVVGRRSNGSANQFHAHNMAYRREVFLSHQIDDRSERSGGCYLSAMRLRADRVRMVYAEKMFVAHGNDYKAGWGFSKRIRNGHDAANLRNFDQTGVLPYGWLTRIGPLGAPLVAGRRVWDDWFRLAQRHEDLEVPAWAIPYVGLVAIPMRLVEGVAYAVSTVRPTIIGKYWG
jgi:glycosyltransferase involved in cell wall biosynthesis